MSAGDDEGGAIGGRASLVRDDVPYRLQRRLRLIPAEGFGTGRRVVFFALLTWLPIAAWAVLGGTGAAAGEPLLRHFGVHVRCLVAIPLFILAEPLLHDRLRTLLPRLVRVGIVQSPDVPRLVGIVARVGRLRDATSPWVVIVAAVASWTVLAHAEPPHEATFAVDSTGSSRLAFGGWWFLYVSRPIYLAFGLGWLWRVVLAAVLFGGIARLPLALVPTHPDRAGGLQFLERVATAFAPVVLATSSVVAAGWAHDELYHGVAVATLRGPIVVLLVVMTAVVLSPLLVFTPPLAAAKRQALADYGVLVATHGRLVRRRWIAGEPVEDGGLLSAPEIGPVADTLALYDAVQRMRVVLVGKLAIGAVLVPALVPIAAALSIQVPVKDLLLKVLKTLV